MGKAARIKKVRELKNRMKPDERTLEALVELRQFVENINNTPDLSLRGGVYKELAKADVHTRTLDGVEFGYKLEDKGPYFRRYLFIKVLGYTIEEIPDDQIEPIVVAAMEAILDKGSAVPEIYGPGDIIEGITIGGKKRNFGLGPNLIVLTQDFVPMFLVEKNPGLVSISNRPDTVH